MVRFLIDGIIWYLLIGFTFAIALFISEVKSEMPFSKGERGWFRVIVALPKVFILAVTYPYAVWQQIN